MKKIFSTLALAIFTAMAFSACSDDDNEWVDPNGEPLKVISNETSFDAPASTGSIVVDTTDPVTVTSNDNGWVTTTVNGNTIEVAVTDNTGLDGRVATLTIKAGSKKTDVSIVQAGAIFKMDLDHIYRSSNAAYTLSVPVTANLPVTVSSQFDWIQPSFDAETNTLTVKLTANTTKHMRQGYFEYTCGTTTGEIPVKQCVFSTDVKGAINLYFTNIRDGKRYYIPAEITGTQTAAYLEIPAYEIKIPMKYSTANFTVSLAAGQQVGTVYDEEDGVEYILGTMLWDTEAGYITWNEKCSMSGEIQNGFLSNGDQVTLVTIADDGTWGTYVSDTFRIQYFKSFPFSGTNRGPYYLECFMNPQLIRVDVPAASTKTATKAVKSMNDGAINAMFAPLAPIVKRQVDNGNLKVAF